MPKTIIDAKNFQIRKELENSIEIKTPEIKQDIEIKGTIEELARLGLSYRTFIFGIKCVATDFKSEKKENKEKPQRGEIKKFNLT